jgi:hypothetical protein
MHCTTRFPVLLALHGIKIPCRQYDIEYDIVLFTATLFTSLDKALLAYFVCSRPGRQDI